jgi:hypothetical protein
MTRAVAESRKLSRKLARNLIALAGAALLGAGMPALPSAAAEPGEDFAITDRNSDGFIDRGEFHQRMVEAFFFADVDRNGWLTARELPGVAPETFRGADRNGDGVLGLTEFTEARALDFRQADTDGDGLLSRAEVEAVSGRGTAGGN